MKPSVADVTDISAAVVLAETEVGNNSHLARVIRKHSWIKWIMALMAIKMALFLIGVGICYFADRHFVPDNLRWLDVWYQWDVREYLTVTENGYEPGTPNARLAVRPPIVPLMIRGIAFLGINNLLVAGFIMATLASLPVPVLMEKLAALDYPARQAGRSTWFLLIFPMSFCLHLPLSEGIFLVLTLNSFLSARNDQWLESGISAALAGATRVNGVLLFPALLVEIAHQYHLRRKIQPQWLWVGLAPLGALAYLTMNRLVFGNAVAFMQSTPGLSWPWISVARLFQWTVTQAPLNAILWVYPQCITLIVLFAVAIWACFKCRPSYSVWTILNIALMTSQHFIFSVPRYAIAVFPMFLLLSEVTKQRFLCLAITACFIFFFLYFSILFANGWWAF